MRLRQFKKGTANLMALGFFASIALSASGCGQNFGNAFGDAVNSSQNTGGGGAGSTANPWAGVELQGVASNPLFGTYQVFTIDTVNNLLIFHIPISGSPFGAAVSGIAIPDLPGASISFTASGIDISIPLSDLVKGVSFSSPTTLPNGEALPGVPAGELPELGVSIQEKSFSMNIYGSVKYFAVYVPVPQLDKYLSYINLITLGGGQLTFPINNQAGTEILGYFSVVAPTGTFDGGFYVSLVFPPALQAALDSLF